MIDQEECFYGYSPEHNRSETDGRWGNVNSFLSVQILKDSVKFSEVEDFISEIEQLTDDNLKELIGLIPTEYYTPEQTRAVFNLLQVRRNNLRQIIQTWCTSENKL